MREATDIVDLISQYCLLKKTGGNYKALCPFHSERTSSFVVSPTKQIFHCFGCHVGGNCFQFLMKHEGMDFITALKNLAQRAGISLPTQDSKVDNRKELLYNINLAAMSFYQKLLKSSEGENCRNYLKKRGVSPEIIDKAKLGFSGEGGQRIMKHLSSMGYTLEIIKEAGLIILSEREPSSLTYYDRFRERLIFPIFNLTGRVVGFAGRVLGDSLPKYLNSPETPIYQKGQLAYGLNFAKEAIRQKGMVIIVEGYMDVLACLQHGIENVVATCGTAITADHIKLLKRYTQMATTMFDPDPAGVEATLRGISLLIEGGMDVRVSSLKEGLDPAELLKKEGKDALVNTLNEAKDFLDYWFRVLYVREDLSTSSGKMKILERLLPLVTKIPNLITQQDFIRRLAQQLQIEEELIRLEIKRLKGKNITPLSTQIKKQERLDSEVEYNLIRLMIEEREATEYATEHLDISDIYDKGVKEIFLALREGIGRGEYLTVDKLTTLVTELTASLITELTLTPLLSGDKKRALYDYINYIKKRPLIKRKMAIAEEIMRLNENDSKISDLQQEYQSIDKQIRGLA